MARPPTGTRQYENLGDSGEGGIFALRSSEPSVHPGRRAVRRAEELLQLLVAELRRRVPQPEHALEELVHGGPPSRVVAGNRAGLRLCRLWHQPGAENLHPVGASGAPRGGPQHLIPGREVPGRFLDCLAVVEPGEPRVGAANVRVHRGLFPAPAQEAWLWEDGDAEEPLLPDAERALHRRVAVPGPQCPTVGGRRSEVPGMDVGRGVGLAQGCVPSMHRRVAEMRLLGHRAKRPHGGRPQFEVAVTAGDNELGVAGARRRVLRDGVRLVQQLVAVVGGGWGKPERVLGVLPARARAVLKPPQGHLVDYLCRAGRNPNGPLVVRVPQEVANDLGVHLMHPRPVDAVLQGKGSGHPLPVRYRARDGQCPCAGEVGREGDSGGMPAGPAPRRVGGRLAPGFWDSIVSSGAEPPRVVGGGVPLDVRVAGGQLVYTQGQSVVGAGRRVIMEADLGPGDRARPGSERRQVLPEPRWASALMYHKVPGVHRLVLLRVHRHVLVVWHCRSHQQGGAVR